MVYSRKFSKKYSRKGAKRTYKRKSFASKKKPVLKYVIKKELARMVETKDRTVSAVNQPVLSVASTTNWDATIIPMTPWATFNQIDQGTGNGSRIGNKIQTTRCLFKGSLCTSPQSASNPSPKPLVIRMWFFYSKEDPKTTTSPRLNLFDNNNASNPMSGTLNDTWRSINTEQWAVVKTAEFKLGYSNYDGTAANPAAQTFGNNDFSMYKKFKFDLTKHVPKNITFVDNNSNPSSRILLCAYQAMYADNTAMGANNISATISYEVEYGYKDA